MVGTCVCNAFGLFAHAWLSEQANLRCRVWMPHARHERDLISARYNAHAPDARCRAFALGRLGSYRAAGGMAFGHAYHLASGGYAHLVLAFLTGELYAPCFDKRPVRPGPVSLVSVQFRLAAAPKILADMRSGMARDGAGGCCHCGDRTQPAVLKTQQLLWGLIGLALLCGWVGRKMRRRFHNLRSRSLHVPPRRSLTV